MATIIINRTVNLDGPIMPESLGAPLYQSEIEAHQFVIAATRGGAPIALTGTVQGRMIRPDGQTLALTGTITGGKAVLVLPQAAYAYQGRFALAIINVASGVTTVLYAAMGDIRRTTTGSTIDPGSVVPDITQLLAMLDEMAAATAAAEAAAERSVAVQGILANNADLDDIDADTIWGMSSGRTYAHKPPIVSGFVHTYVFSDGIVTQWAHELDYSKVYGRRLLAGSWSEWEPWNAEEWQEHAVVNMGLLPSGTNLNSITGNAIYGLGSQQTYTNKPDIESGFLHSIKFSDGFGSQFAHELNGSKIYARRLLSGSWSAWARIDTPRALQVYDTLSTEKPTIDDLNDVRETGIWGISSQSSYDHCPLPSSGWLECYRFHSGMDIYVQRVWSLDDAESFTRYYINGAWSAWTSRDGRDLTNVYYAFGDSTTYGAVGGVLTQSPHNYPACVGRLLKMTVKNKAVGGQGLIANWTDIHTNFINGLDMSDAALISVGWAYNDGAYYSGMNFGAYDDTGSTTFIGKYFTIMKEFQQKCPTARIVLITGYGWPDGTVSPMTKPTLTEQFTHKYSFADGQKSIKEMYDTLEEMCYLHGWACINQARGGTPFNQWNVDEMIGDQIHPTEDGYMAYGNMIAARMSALWANLYRW